MKYTVELQIAKPREEVFKLFDNMENLYKWQPTLQSAELISGSQGQPGAKTKLVYLQNGKPFEMVETITDIRSPEEFKGTYEAKGVFNWIHCRFSDENGHTKMVMDSEFKFSGFMWIMGLFMKGMCRKQTVEMLENFKKFAESA